MSANSRPTIKNRRARHEYDIIDTYEAGIELRGNEVKSIRNGQIDLQGSYCRFLDGDLFLVEAHVKKYRQASTHEGEYDPTRPRRLLLHQYELDKLRKEVEQRGRTIVPLKLYFDGHLAKLEIALAEGKKQHDKREDIKRREAQRRMQEKDWK